MKKLIFVLLTCGGLALGQSPRHKAVATKPSLQAQVDALVRDNAAKDAQIAAGQVAAAKAEQEEQANHSQIETLLKLAENQNDQLTSLSWRFEDLQKFTIRFATAQRRTLVDLTRFYYHGTRVL